LDSFFEFRRDGDDFFQPFERVGLASGKLCEQHGDLVSRRPADGLARADRKKSIVDINALSGSRPWRHND